MAALTGQRHSAGGGSESTLSLGSSWKIVDQKPDASTVTVEIRRGNSYRKIDLKGVPLSAAYFGHEKDK